MSRTYVYLGFVEALVFFLASQLGVYARFGGHLSDVLTFGYLLTTGVFFALCMSVAMVAMGLYQRDAQEHEAAFVVRIGLAFGLGLALLAVGFFAVPYLYMGRGVLGLSLVFAFVGVSLVREVFARLVAQDSRRRRVLVLGAGVNASIIAEALTRVGTRGLHLVGYVPLPRSHTMIDDSLLLRGDQPLVELAMAHGVEEIVVAADDRRGTLPVDDLVDCKLSGIEVLDLLSFFEKEQQLVRIDLLHPSWNFFSPRGVRMGMAARVIKRLFDLGLALVILIPGAPLMLLVALASLIESRGRDPILYHQVRVGQHGNLFHVHKFRSMRVDAEADGVARWATTNDSRITALGSFIRKTRLDELPQIFNVIKGQMSLVGPRPERPEFVQRLSASIPYYAERHRVKPGVTGWAQLLYSYGSDEEDARRKLEYDLYYVKHAGLVLDLVILLQTVEVVIFGKGAR